MCLYVYIYMYICLCVCMPSILGGECEPHRALQDESEEQLKQKHQELEEVKEAVHRILGGLGDDPTG